MGHRTGTPMRLVSPASVLVPGAAPPRPQAPTIYQPAQGTPQTMYPQQNNSNNIGGKRFNLLSLTLFILSFSFLHISANKPKTTKHSFKNFFFHLTRFFTIRF
jgi:hypothetical protein